MIRPSSFNFAFMARALITIGRLEHIALPGIGVARVEAKIDTGAYRSALHYQALTLRTKDGVRQLVVTFQMGGVRKVKVFRSFKRVSVKSSNGETSRRYLINTQVKLNGVHPALLESPAPTGQ